MSKLNEANELVAVFIHACPKTNRNLSVFFLIYEIYFKRSPLDSLNLKNKYFVVSLELYEISSFLYFILLLCLLT